MRDKTKAALAPAGSTNPSHLLAGTQQAANHQAGVLQASAASPTWLSLKAYQILTLVKLRTYGAAADELKLLGNLDDPRYNTAPDGSSAVPHALRVLAAELPRLLGQPVGTSTRSLVLSFAPCKRLYLRNRRGVPPSDVLVVKDETA